MNIQVGDLYRSIYDETIMVIGIDIDEEYYTLHYIEDDSLDEEHKEYIVALIEGGIWKLVSRVREDNK